MLSMNYLISVLYNHNGKFRKTQKHAAEQGRKALFYTSETTVSIGPRYIHINKFHRPLVKST
jgi:hypothetical protein